MTNINFIETLKINLYNIVITPGNLIHCVDSNESYFDTDSSKRIFTGDITYLKLDSDRVLMQNPQSGIYFIKETNLVYKYDNVTGWVSEPIDSLESIFTSNIDITKYIPITLTRNGHRVAPRTFTDCVFSQDGKNLTQLIENLEANEPITVTIDVPATVDKQTNFTIPYPMIPYDLDKNIMIITYNNKLITDYSLSPDLLTSILNMDIPLGDKVSFTFKYTKSTETTNANSINNIRLFLKRPTTPQFGDVVLDMVKRIIEQYDGTNWINIGTSNALIMKRTNTILTTETSAIDIDINDYDKAVDSLIVIQNSSFLYEDTDFYVSDDSKQLVAKNGNWMASDRVPINILILCFKNVPTISGKFSGLNILDGTIEESALAPDIVSKLNRDFVTQNGLNVTINNLKDGVVDSLGTLGKIAAAINNDPLFSAKILKSITDMNTTLENLSDIIKNKLNITVSTSDNVSTANQNITVVNNVTHNSTVYPVGALGETLSIDTDKFTSYSVSVDNKSGYMTPPTRTFNSGHLGDITTLSFVYEK